MDESLYFRLLVIALCSVSECSQRRYHHININMTWTEAQRYCRENYTDLATVNNMNDMNELMSQVNESGVNNNDLRVWIGLKNTSDYTWKRSMGHTVNYTNWKDEKPDKTNDCTYMKNSEKWHHKDCNKKLSFICYNESSKKYIYNTTKTTWRDAQRSCRENQTDLTSVRNKYENEQIQKIMNDSQISEVWIGLFNDSWEWSDNSDSTFRNWNSGEPNNAGNSESCTEVLMNDQGQWNNIVCSTSQTFVCHEDNLILINERMSWSEALVYCRQHHVDLVSVVSDEIQRWVTEVIEHQDSTASVWMGLRHSCSVGIWFWVNGEPVCYQNWAPENETSVEDCDPKVRSGAVQRDGDHQWISHPDTDELNFICITYD
ncbi:macrophage mannose receptor 1-like [Misgurnus anguillicaudatus]|uniref:macrophage mannose receptor 1-like n=1 Tax=Misgurnus anguillicaudatus TaxID=75329 RepID=UPI003CCFCF0A